MLKKLFGFNPQTTTIRTEIFSGITAFLTMSYILAVNPSIFSALEGMPTGAVFTATALVAVFGSLLIALVAKMPFAIAPAMGSNVFFVTTVCINMGYSWQFALTAIFLEGIIMMILTLTKLREAIVNAIPKSIKQSITVGIGLFIAFIGLQNAGLVVNDDSSLVKLGDITSNGSILTLIGIVITAVLTIRNVKGGLLIGILATTLIGIPMGITHMDGVVAVPESVGPIFCQFEWNKIFTVDMLIVVLSFLSLDLVSLTGTAIGVCVKEGYVDKNGKIPAINKVFIADSAATISSGILGTSAACMFIESTAGAAQGGRSGLSALTTAVCFAAALFFAPLFLAIPSAATAPILIVVGLMMFSSVKDIDLKDYSEAIPAFITIILMPLAYSISDGILLGVISYVAFNLLSGKYKKLTAGMYVLAALFILKYIFV